MHTIVYNKWKPLLVQNGADIIAALFILLFAYTGINKLLGIEGFRHVIKDYPLIGRYAPAMVWLVPAMELLVVLWLLILRTRLLGLYGSLTLMIIFTGYIGYLLLYTTQKYCTCGGMLQQLTMPQHLVFNILCILLAISGIWLYKKRRRRALP